MATSRNDDTPDNDYDDGVDYDTDSVSITSTVASTWSETALYDVEEIISERTYLDRENKAITQYLTKWVGYPLHKCTFEPVEHLDGTTLLTDWEAKCAQLGEPAFSLLKQENFDKFNRACDTFAVARARRHEKRAKKREKLRATARPSLGGANSDSENDASPSRRASLGESRGKKSAASVFSREMRRRSTPEQTASSPSSTSKSDTDTDSLLEQIRTEASDAERRRQKPLEQIGRPQPRKDHSISSKNTGRRIDQSTVNSSVSMQEKESDPKGGQPAKSLKAPIRKSSGQSTGPPHQSQAPNVNNSAAATSGDNAQMERPTQSMRRSAPNPAPIRMVNEPKTASKTTWHRGAQSQYTKMHFRRKAELRGRDEQTPDLNALDWVGGPSTGISRASVQTNDGSYSRHDTAPSKPNQAQQGENSPPSSPFSPPEWEKHKVPMTCYNWRTDRSCPYSAEQCKFLHRDTDKIGSWDGWIPPKYARPKVTCPYWMRSGCFKTDEECNFAHYNTGWLAADKGNQTQQIDPNLEPDHIRAKKSQEQSALEEEFVSHPMSSSLEKHDLTCIYWLRKGCNKFEKDCKYSHRNTGWLYQGKGLKVLKIDTAGNLIRTNAASHKHSDIQVTPHGGPDSRSFRKPGALTCFFWYNGRKCTKGENCKFLHYDTGMVADPPAGFRKFSASTILPSNTDSNLPRSTSDFDIPDASFTSSSLPRTTATFGDSSKYETPASRTSTTPVVALNSMGPSCMELKKSIESACKLDFIDMFEGDKENKILDRRAFLIFHPGDHSKELELITRWLLMHHVEVCSFWFDGSWDYFRQKVKAGGSGVVIAHPDFQNYSEIPGFGELLMHKVRIWSVGVQFGYEYDPYISTVDPLFRYDCIEIFPRGGIIYITDDVFEQQPVEALKIIELFISKVERCRQVTGPIDPSKFVNDGCLLWRLATRPDLMESIWQQCLVHGQEIDAQDPIQSTRAQLYELLHRTQYVDQGSPIPQSLRAEDYFPIMSERPEFMSDYYNALTRSQKEANSWMVEMYAGLCIDRRRDYRSYSVVHTEPTQTDWKKACQNIDEIMTPEKCIEYLEQPAEGNRFDFYEWAFHSRAGVQS